MNWLRTEITGLDTWFAPIATAHFFAHVRHSPCITDDEGKQTWHPLGKWSLCVCSCEPRSSRKCQAISDSVNRQSLWEHRNDFTLLNARWPPFFFSWITSFPDFVHFNQKTYARNYKYFAFYALLQPKFFLRLICIVFPGLFHLRKRHQLWKFI